MNPEQLFITAIVTMAGVIVTLWRNDVNNRKREQERWHAEVKDLKKQLGEAIDRIRHLEDRRTDDAIQHGHELKAIAERLIKEQAESTAVLRGVREAFSALTKAMSEHECLADYSTKPLRPITDTETICKKCE